MVAPTYLIAVFVAFCYSNLGAWIRDVQASPLRQGAIGLVLAVLLLLVWCVRIGEKRWSEAGRAIDEQSGSAGGLKLDGEPL